MTNQLNQKNQKNPYKFLISLQKFKELLQKLPFHLFKRVMIKQQNSKYRNSLSQKIKQILPIYYKKLEVGIFA